MGVCKDDRLTFLNQHGYNVVRLPREGIVPLGVIGIDNKSKTWLGTIDKIWKSSEAVPPLNEPNAVGNLKGQSTSDLKLSLGLEILANALSAFGATSPSLDTAYKNAKSVSFVFKDVESLGIDPFVIGNFLASGDLASKNPVVKRFFSGQKHVEALIITEVLQAKSIGVVGKRDAGVEVNVDVPAIQQTVGAKVGVTVGTSSQSEVVYEGQKLLTFGFKAFSIGMENGEWNIKGVEPDAEHAFAIGQGLTSVVNKDELVDIDFGTAKPKAKVKAKAKAKSKSKSKESAHGRRNNSRKPGKVRADQLRQKRKRARAK